MKADDIAMGVFGDEWQGMSKATKDAVTRCLVTLMGWDGVNITIPQCCKASTNTYTIFVRDSLIRICRQLWGVDKEDFTSHSRDSFVTTIRIVCANLMSQYTNLRAAAISKAFFSFRGRCDVIYYLNIFEDRYNYDKQFKRIFEETKEHLDAEIKKWKDEQ